MVAAAEPAWLRQQLNGCAAPNGVVAQGRQVQGPPIVEHEDRLPVFHERGCARAEWERQDDGVPGKGSRGRARLRARRQDLRGRRGGRGGLDRRGGGRERFLRNRDDGSGGSGRFVLGAKI